MSTSQFGTATASHLLPSISTFLQTPHELSTVSHTTNAGVDINSLTYGPDKKLTAVTLDLPDGGQIKSQSWLTSCPAPPHKNIEQIIQQTRTISESVSSLKGCTVVDPATWLNNMTKNARVLLYSLNELYSDHTDSNCTTRINSRLDYDLIWRRRVSKGRFGKTRARKRSICTPQLRCHSCNVTETPEWRRGPDGARTLCNACGLHYAKLTKGNNLKVNPKSNVQLSPSASISKRDAPSTQC
ncbi:GATA zinc finger-domain-containing protein [Umbelopsis sp. AD052]|nr:GATA zinc finger-domain-containing protein [Umbelopsis sp. AD052]